MSTLTITTIQTNLHWEDKPANLKMLEEKIMGIKEKTEIVVLPEMFNTGFTMQPEKLAETMEGETVAWMKRMAMEKRVVLVGSVAIKTEERTETGLSERTETVSSYTNRLLWMLPNGQYGYYDKRHLFAFAGEDQHYTAGNKRLIASVKGWKINLQVCYDLRFPVWARNRSFAPFYADASKGAQDDKASSADISNQPEYDVLVYVANWPERRSHAWKTLLQARAIENQCYVVGVNRVGNDGNNIYHSGDSMIVDPLGEVLYTKKDEEDIHTITIDKAQLDTVREKLPFLKDGDGFSIS
jgi:omega-amidase